MDTQHPPDFDAIASTEVKRGFRGHRPDEVSWLSPGTKLFKWTKSIITPKGVSPWWQLLLGRTLTTGSVVPGIRELQAYASRLNVHDRDYGRARSAVTNQWNTMTNAVAIELLEGRWGFIGQALGQRVDADDPGVFFIGGGWQVWVPGIAPSGYRQISITPYLTPNAPFGARPSP